MKRLPMKPHKTNGYLITFCGLDGCGKSTMIESLRKYMENRGYAVFVTKQPTPSLRESKIFRTYMDSEDHSAFEYRALSLMAAADRVQHSNQVIMSRLQEGKVVICDRYLYSCLANLRARGYTSDRWLYEVAKSIPRPDLAFFLDLPVNIAVTRVRARPEERDRYIDMELQYSLRNQYIKICRRNGGISVPTQGCAEASFEVIRKNTEKYLEDRKWMI